MRTISIPYSTTGMTHRVWRFWKTSFQPCRLDTQSSWSMKMSFLTLERPGQSPRWTGWWWRWVRSRNALRSSGEGCYNRRGSTSKESGPMSKGPKAWLRLRWRYESGPRVKRVIFKKSSSTITSISKPFHKRINSKITG